MLDVVAARPGELDRPAPHLAREQRRLDHEVRLGLAAEAAAEQRDVHGHLIGLQRQRGGHRVARGLRVLDRRPDLAATVDDAGGRHGRLHRRVRDVRQVVLGLELARRGRQGRRGVAVVAERLAGPTRGPLQRRLVGDGVVGRVRPVGPLELEGVAALERGPGVARDHCDAAERVEHRRQGRGRQRRHANDAGDLERLAGVEAGQLAGQHRRTGDHGVEHAVEAHVDAVGGLAAHDALAIDVSHRAGADVAELLRILQPQRVARRHGQAARIGGQFSEAEPASAAHVEHRMLARRDLADGDAPAGRRGGLEHAAHRRADPPQRVEALPQAARAVGVLVAVARVIAVGLDDLHPRPVGLHLVGDHHRHAGAYALAHLGAMAHDAHGAVGRQHHEGQGIVDQASGHGVAAVLLVLRGREDVAAAGHADGQAARAEPLEQLAARQGRGGHARGAVHHLAPPAASERAACFTAARMRV